MAEEAKFMNKRMVSLVAVLALIAAPAFAAGSKTLRCKYVSDVYTCVNAAGTTVLTINASTGVVAVGAGGLTVDGVTIDSSTTALTDLTATAAELNKNAGVTGGTVAASKTVVVDANKDIDFFRNLYLGTSGASGVAGSLVVSDGANPGTATTITQPELAMIDGITAGTAAAGKSVVPNADGDVTSGLRDVSVRDIKTSSGVGAAAGTGVAAVEYGTAAVHKTVLTLTAHSMTMTDHTTAGSQGSTKVYDFPEGAIQILGSSYNLTITRVGTAIGATAAAVGALGTAAAGIDNATLTATEANLIASTTGTLTAGAGALALHGSLVAAAFDGHTTPVDAILNVAVPDADSSGNDAFTVAGTITLVWANLGDY
jgi:hypothetical protein